MKVKAIQKGYFKRRIYVDEVFEIPDSAFAASWMEKLEEPEVEKSEVKAKPKK